MRVTAFVRALKMRVLCTKAVTLRVVRIRCSFCAVSFPKDVIILFTHPVADPWREGGGGGC